MRGLIGLGKSGEATCPLRGEVAGSPLVTRAAVRPVTWRPLLWPSPGTSPGSVTTSHGRPLPTARSLIKAGTVAAGTAAAGLLLAGCGTGVEGVRTEGPARPESAAPVARTAPQPSPASVKFDPIAALKHDPKVSDQIRRELKPCAPGEYPVDVSYGNLTGNGGPDVIVNVLTCGDAIGIGSYVYRRASGRHAGYEDVFANERTPVYAEISKGDLEVTQQVYRAGDQVSYPSGEDIVTYHWTGDRFTEQARTHNEYSKAAEGSEPTTDPEG